MPQSSCARGTSSRGDLTSSSACSWPSTMGTDPSTAHRLAFPAAFSAMTNSSTSAISPPRDPSAVCAWTARAVRLRIASIHRATAEWTACASRAAADSRRTFSSTDAAISESSLKPAATEMDSEMRSLVAEPPVPSGTWWSSAASALNQSRSAAPPERAPSAAGASASSAAGGCMRRGGGTAIETRGGVIAGESSHAGCESGWVYLCCAC